MAVIARLYRVVPIMLALAAIAVVVYLVVSRLRTPARAKEVLVKLFTWLCSALAVFFGAVAAYAVSEGNEPVFDLAVGFALVGLLGLGVTRLCNAVFIRNHPNYRSKPQKAKVERRWPWER